MKFRPLQDRVLIRRVEQDEKTAGGIIIPDTAKEKPMEGEVVAAGPGARESERLNFRYEDLADEDTFNRVLWVAIKGPTVPYPGSRRMPALEWKRHD